MGPALVGGLILNVLAAVLLTWLLLAGGPRAYLPASFGSAGLMPD